MKGSDECWPPTNMYMTATQISLFYSKDKQKFGEDPYNPTHLAMAITSWYPCMYPKECMSGRSSTSSVHPTLCSNIVPTAAVTDKRSDSKCPPDGGAFVWKENSANDHCRRFADIFSARVHQLNEATAKRFDKQYLCIPSNGARRD